MLDSLGEWVGIEEFIQVFYNSWVNVKIQFAKRNVLNTIWKIGIWLWNHLGPVWYVCLKTENCCLKIFVEVRVGEKMCWNAWNVV